MATRYAAMAEIGRQETSRPNLAHTTVTGGGGVQLHVVETGNPRGRPIVFIHGASQCWLTWSRQMHSDLAGDYRLVAMDLRGHGLSETPREGYDDSRLWADDVDAVIRALGLDRPVLCGWSYGPLVILDYLRHHGEARIGGVNFAGAVTKLGSDAAMALLTPDLLDLVPSLFATDVQQSERGLEAFVRLCFASDLSEEEFYLMLGYNMSVLPAVRQALLTRTVDNDDLLPTIRTPVLITHGAADAIVKPAAVDQHKADIAHAEIRLVTNAGHAPFWDDPATFNQHLRSFCESL